MKHIKPYSKFQILEKKTSEFIYSKYYQDIDKDMYDKITQADPTYKNDVNGKYSKWLLNLYKSNNLRLEDLYKATPYLKAFNDFKYKLPSNDIFNYKSLAELFKDVSEYVVSDDENLHTDEYKIKGQYREVFRNDKYRIIIPKTLEASKYFGKGSGWCTINTDDFEKYTKNQKLDKPDENCLFIIKSKDNTHSKQFHFKERQFMDFYDYPIDIGVFLNDNADIKNYFSSIINDLRPYYMDFNEFIPIFFKENNINVKIIPNKIYSKKVSYLLEEIAESNNSTFWDIFQKNNNYDCSEDFPNSYKNVKELLEGKTKYAFGDSIKVDAVYDPNVDLIIIEPETLKNPEIGTFVGNAGFYLINNENIDSKLIKKLSYLYFPNTIFYKYDNGLYGNEFFSSF